MVKPLYCTLKANIILFTNYISKDHKKNYLCMLKYDLGSNLIFCYLCTSSVKLHKLVWVHFLLYKILVCCQDC